MSRSLFTEGLPEDFDRPIGLPADATARLRWQEANRSWWAEHPMQYDWDGKERYEPGSREYFEAMDDRFLSAAAEFLPPLWFPFDLLIPYAKLADLDVLEIGVGSGTHASLLCTHARSFTGIDLTESAVAMSRKRFEVFGLNGKLAVMDAENLDFPDDSFNFVWSWGSYTTRPTRLRPWQRSSVCSDLTAEP